MTNNVPWIRIFLAPALTVIAFVWTIAVSPHTKYGDNWALYPVFVAFLGVLGLHASLVIRSAVRPAMIAYALLHIGLWVPFGLWCLMRISKDSV